MSKITVTTIAGATSGSDANKVKIESGDDLVVESGGIGIGTSTVSTAIGGGIEIHRANGSSFRIEDTTNSVVGELQVYSNGVNLVAQTNHPIIVSPNNAEIARFTTAGLHLGGTGAANALDDYEEGTWTPSFSASSPPTVNYNSQVGNYTKVGRMVMVNFYLVTGSVSGGSGDLKIAGLPFAVNGPAGSRTGNAQHWNSGINSNSSIGGYGSGTEIILAQNNNDRVQVSDLRTSNDSNQLWWSFSYITNA